MNNKKLIISCLICILFSCSNLLAYRASARGKTCMSNIRIIQGAIEMYNMDHPSSELKQLDRDAINELIKGKYLKDEPQKPDSQCDLLSIGDLSKDGIIYCIYHGDLEHLIYCDYYKNIDYDQHKKLPQNTTIEEINQNREKIKEERNKLREIVDLKHQKEKEEKERTNFIENLIVFGSLITALIVSIIIEIYKKSKKRNS